MNSALSLHHRKQRQTKVIPERHSRSGRSDLVALRLVIFIDIKFNNTDTNSPATQKQLKFYPLTSQARIPF